MADKSSFLDRLLERVEAIDSSSIQAYILRLSREKGFFETVFNAVDEGILVIDRKLRIVYHNQAGQELLGLPDELRNVRISQFLREVDWRKILSGDVGEWQKIVRQEIEIIYPVRRILQFYLVPFGEEPTFATVILHDVTESTRLKNEELSSKTSDVIAQLAAGVAHEIGNPLNSLSLNLQLLQRKFRTQCSEGDTEDRDDTLEMISACREEVERLDHIIHQFLHAVRPVTPLLSPLDIRTVIVETLQFMHHEIELRGVKVSCDWPGELPLINGDLDQLKQAFFNILKNAIQAVINQGEIVISCSEDDEYINVEITDNGVGITSEQMCRIFDPFKSFKSDGNGVGMLIIERVLKAHGAELVISSQPERGTAILIRFPRSQRKIKSIGSGEFADGDSTSAASMESEVTNE